MHLLITIGVIIAALVVIAVATYWLMPERIVHVLLALARRGCGLHDKRTVIPGCGIVYLDGEQPDDTREPLLLLHGIGADKDHFTRSAGILRERFRVIIPDLPGFGESDRPGDDCYGIFEQVENLRGFLGQLGLKQVHLGGNSMGGWVAAHFAAKYPEQVRSLWLLAPAGVESAQDSDMMRRVEAGESPPLFARTPREFNAVLAYVVNRKPTMPGVMRRVLARRAANDCALHTRIFNRLLVDRPALEPVLPRITMPTLVVWGAKDCVLDPAGAAILQQGLPDAEAIVMPDIGHLPMMEAVGKTARDYLDFISRHCP